MKFRRARSIAHVQFTPIEVLPMDRSGSDKKREPVYFEDDDEGIDVKICPGQTKESKISEENEASIEPTISRQPVLSSAIAVSNTLQTPSKAADVQTPKKKRTPLPTLEEYHALKAKVAAADSEGADSKAVNGNGTSAQSRKRKRNHTRTIKPVAEVFEDLPELPPPASKNEDDEHVEAPTTKPKVSVSSTPKQSARRTPVPQHIPSWLDPEFDDDSSSDDEEKLKPRKRPRAGDGDFSSDSEDDEPPPPRRKKMVKKIVYARDLKAKKPRGTRPKCRYRDRGVLTIPDRVFDFVLPSKAEGAPVHIKQELEDDGGEDLWNNGWVAPSVEEDDEKFYDEDRPWAADAEKIRRTALTGEKAQEIRLAEEERKRRAEEDKRLVEEERARLAKVAEEEKVRQAKIAEWEKMKKGMKAASTKNATSEHKNGKTIIPPAHIMRCVCSWCKAGTPCDHELAIDEVLFKRALSQRICTGVWSTGKVHEKSGRNKAREWMRRRGVKLYGEEP